MHSGRQLFAALLEKEDVVVWNRRVLLQINLIAVNMVCWQGRYGACLFLSYAIATACSFIYTLLIFLLVMFAFVLQFSHCGVLGM